MRNHVQPFYREGLSQRAAPFVGSLLLASAFVHLQPQAGHELGVVVAAALLALIVVTVMVVPWHRLPAWLQAWPPLVFLLVVALLRESQGGASSSYAPLVILPIFWFALYGTRLQLALGIVGVGATFIVPILALGYPTQEWRTAMIWVVVATFVGATVQPLVGELRDRAARLEAAVRIDHLTGLPNRRAWEETLPRELARALREERPVCVAMLDLDEFKAFNDREGHQAGDRLLKEIGAAWAGRVRATDTVCRYGGDEFTVIFPGCALPDALILIERLRAATPRGQAVSAGVVRWDGLETAEALVGRADRALYEFKHVGRPRPQTASAFSI